MPYLLSRQSEKHSAVFKDIPMGNIFFSPLFDNLLESFITAAKPMAGGTILCNDISTSGSVFYSSAVGQYTNTS